MDIGNKQSDREIKHSYLNQFICDINEIGIQHFLSEGFNNIHLLPELHASLMNFLQPVLYYLGLFERSVIAADTNLKLLKLNPPSGIQMGLNLL